jgi:hypothetical protein
MMASSEHPRAGESGSQCSALKSRSGAPRVPRRVVICVNGILTDPGASDGWTDRAVTWLHLHTEARAEKFEYAAGALTRRLWQQERAQAIARMVHFYAEAGFTVDLVGHSNGCDLIARVLGITASRHFATVHLFAAAADDPPFADALARRQVGLLFLYGSENDRALHLARASRTLLGWAGLGYGDLGLRVRDFAATQPRTIAHLDNTQTHSSWFARGAQFEATMRLLAANTMFNTDDAARAERGAPFEP